MPKVLGRRQHQYCNIYKNQLYTSFLEQASWTFKQVIKQACNYNELICHGFKVFSCYAIKNNVYIREGFKKKYKKMARFIHPCWLAGVSRGPKSNPQKIVLIKKYKDYQNSLIHPEN